MLSITFYILSRSKKRPDNISMDRYMASHWQDSTFNFDPRRHAYLWLYPHLFAAFKRLKLHDPFNVAYECWMFLIGMFVFSFSYRICKYVHSALQQSTMNSKRTGWSTNGCSQRDPIANNDRTRLLFMMDAWFAKQSWLNESASWLTTSHSSVSSLSSWSSRLLSVCIFVSLGVVLCFLFASLFP